MMARCRSDLVDNERAPREQSFSAPSLSAFAPSDPFPDLKEKLTLSQSADARTKAPDSLECFASYATSISSQVLDFQEDATGGTALKTKPSKTFSDQFSGWSSRVRRATHSSLKSIFLSPPSQPFTKVDHSESQPTDLSQSVPPPFCTYGMLKRPRTASTPLDSTGHMEKRRTRHHRLRESPVASLDPMSGAAARQSAREFGRPTTSSAYLQSDTMISTTYRKAASESGVNLLGDDILSQGGDTNVMKKDPVSHLPVDLAILIFSHLDALTLTRCEVVSRSWRNTATEPWIWRNIFSATYDLPTTASSRNRGRDLRQATLFGKRDIAYKHQHKRDTLAPRQKWKAMYKARQQLSSHWRTGQAGVIYLTGHTDSVYCVQFDEDKIITGSRDRTIRVWDTNTGVLRKVIGTPAAATKDKREANAAAAAEPQTSTGIPTYAAGLPVINSAMAGPVARLARTNLASSTSATSEDGYGDIYHTPVYYHNASILCLQYDDDICITGSSDKMLIVWDIHTWQPLRRLQRHTAGVLDIAFDHEKIISCSKDGTICVWGRESGDCLLRLTGHRGPVNAVQLRGNLIVSASGDGCAKLWNLQLDSLSSYAGNLTPSATATCVKDFWSIRKGLACVEFSEDGKYVFAGGGDEVIFKYSTSNGELVNVFKGHTNLVRSLYLDCKNGRLVSGSYDLSLRVWDANTGEAIKSYGDAPRLPSAPGDSNDFLEASGDTTSVTPQVGKFSGIQTLSLPTGNIYNPRSREGQSLRRQTSTSSFSAGSAHAMYANMRARARSIARGASGGRGASSAPVTPRLFKSIGSTDLPSSSAWPNVLSSPTKSTNSAAAPFDRSTALFTTPFPTPSAGSREASQVPEAPREIGMGLASSWMLSAKSDYRRIVGTSQDGRAVVIDFAWGLEGVDLLEG